MCSAPDQPPLFEDKSSGPSRRGMLGWIIVGAGAVTGAILGLPFLGFLFLPYLRRTPSNWQRVGKLESFRIGDTVEVTFTDPSSLPWAGVTAKTGAYLRRSSETEFIAFAVNCTHLGCIVRWVSGPGLFLCPCHGGVYYADGRVAAGPPPHDLYRYQVRVRRGWVELHTRPVPIQ